MMYLNFGCGNRYSPEWVNIDFDSTGPHVKQSNFLGGFPFKDESFHAVYSSHVLEHFSLEHGDFILREAYRVLKPEGLIRIVVPDLEATIREYVRLLDCYDGSIFADQQHEWIMLELLDQLVRRKNLGKVGPHLKQIMQLGDEDITSYIRSRFGSDESPQRAASSFVWERFKRLSGAKLKQKAVMLWVQFVKALIPRKIAESVFDETTFGEKHRWMYDKIGLRRSVLRAGFSQVRFFNAYESQIPRFADFNLDVRTDGKPHKMMSLYLEAIKPKTQIPGIA